MLENREDKYNTIEICKFVVNKTLSTVEALSSTNGTLPYNRTPKTFMGIFAANISFNEDLPIKRNNRKDL